MDMETTPSAVTSALQAAGLDVTEIPFQRILRRRDSEGLVSPDVVTVGVGTQKYLCVSIADSIRLRGMVEAGQRELCKAFRHEVLWMAANGRAELQSTILLDFPALEGVDPAGVAQSCAMLERETKALVLVRGVNEGADEFLARIPGLFSMPMVEYAEPEWQGEVLVEGDGKIPDVRIDFGQGPGLVVLSGGNGSGKTRMVNMLHKAGFGDSVSFPVMRGYPVCGEQLMRPYRKAVGYGRLDGSLVMPIRHEGEGTLRMDRIVAALANSSKGSSSNWPGLVLDTPLSGISEVFLFKLAEIVVRSARNRQVLITCRAPGEAQLLIQLAQAHGVACGSGKLDYNGDVRIQIQVEQPHIPTSISGSSFNP